jgi:hypothetical protein
MLNIWISGGMFAFGVVHIYQGNWGYAAIDMILSAVGIAIHVLRSKNG